MIYVNVDGLSHVQQDHVTACLRPVPFRAEWTRDEPTENRCPDCFPEPYTPPAFDGFVQLQDEEHPDGAPPTVEPTEDAETDAPDPQDLAKLKKDELIALATEAGLDTDGTKADLIERLGPVFDEDPEPEPA